jgi:hypothetical protein
MTTSSTPFLANFRVADDSSTIRLERCRPTAVHESIPVTPVLLVGTRSIHSHSNVLLQPDRVEVINHISNCD